MKQRQLRKQRKVLRSFLYVAFKNNDPLTNNAELQVEAEKIEFKII